MDITPEDFFHAWSRKKREALVEMLIDSLDAEAGDPDLEPSLAACDAGYPGSQLHWAEGNHDEREGDGCADDREGDELEHGGEAVYEDGESWLGWTAIEAGKGRYANNGTDLEEDDAFNDTDLGWTSTGALDDSNDLEIGQVTP